MTLRGPNGSFSAVDFRPKFSARRPIFYRRGGLGGRQPPQRDLLPTGRRILTAGGVPPYIAGDPPRMILGTARACHQGTNFLCFFVIFLGVIFGDLASFWVAWASENAVKMGPKSDFWWCFFHDDLSSIFGWFLGAPNPKNVAPVWAKRCFLQNRRFRKNLKKVPNLESFWEAKSMKNRSKIAARNLFVFLSTFFAFLRFSVDFGLQNWSPN